jgi:hypothetical protein
LKSWDPFLDLSTADDASPLVPPQPPSKHLRDVIVGSFRQKSEEQKRSSLTKKHLKPILLPKLRRATSSFACSWDCERGGWGGGYGK